VGGGAGGVKPHSPLGAGRPELAVTPTFSPGGGPPNTHPLAPASRSEIGSSALQASCDHTVPE